MAFSLSLRWSERAAAAFRTIWFQDCFNAVSSAASRVDAGLKRGPGFRRCALFPIMLQAQVPNIANNISATGSSPARITAMPKRISFHMEKA
jgi:hypothetical protein